jgi:S-adenosylmethionine decarboxylase
MNIPSLKPSSRKTLNLEEDYSMTVLGTHILVELEGCDLNKINSVDFIENTMILAAQEAGATVLGHQFHRFQPQGVSGVVVLAESHISIHTWPEHKFASCDVYVCGNKVDPMKAVFCLVENLGAKISFTNMILRGTVN